jgi:hypothetical protein
MTKYSEVNRVSEKILANGLISTLSNLVKEHGFSVYSNYQYTIKTYPNYLASYGKYHGISYYNAHKTNLKDYIVNYKDFNGVMTKDKLKELRLRMILVNAKANYETR